MKRILVNGYFGKNLGDDLFFKILFDRYPEVEFTSYANYYFRELHNDYKDIFSKYNNVKIKKYNRYRKYFNKLNLLPIINSIQFNKYDAVVYIGGSIFMEASNIGRNAMEKESIFKYFAKDNKKSYVIGSNFGPYKNEGFLEKYRDIFSRCTDVCFRDNYSYGLFNNHNNIRMAPDIVFQLKARNIKKVKDSIGISLIEIQDRENLSKYTEQYVNKITEVVKEGMKRGKKFTFFSFCESQGDLTIINRVISLLNQEQKKYTEIVNYTGDIEGFLEKFESMENIIGTRFHACILSQVFKQGLYPLIYSDKTYNVLKDIKIDKEYCYINNINSLDVNHVLNVIANNKIEGDWVFKESEKQFKGLDKYVKGI